VGRATSSMAMVVRVSKRRVWKNTKPVDQLVEVALVDKSSYLLEGVKS